MALAPGFDCIVAPGADATNGYTARFLAAQDGASLRRVVRSPRRWLRIVGVANEYGETLSNAPDSKALEIFLTKQNPPNSNAELDKLALHRTQQENAAQKVERRMRKSEAALLLESRIGQRFDAIVTGSNTEGVWIRIFMPPTEGKLLNGSPTLKVGGKVHVKLTSANVERGFIDFVTTE